MRWDVVLFLKGYPAKYRFGDEHYFMMGVAADELERLANVFRERFPESGVFFDRKQAEQFTAFGFRGEADRQQAAIDGALKCLNGFLDGSSLLLGHEMPRLGPILTRKGDEDDAHLFLLLDSQWSYFDNHDEHSASWSARSAEIFKQLWPFYDVVAGIHPRRSTALAQQLVYSLRMYRRGACSSMDGVEFICKWSALEGLVSAGGYPKKQKLIERIETLFTDRKEEIAPLIGKLWDIRNNAVHEARVSGVVDAIHQVDELYLGVSLFAVANLDSADSLEQLWSLAPSLTLPSFVKQTRPGRHRILGGTMPAAQMIGGGKLIDFLFAAHAQTLPQSSASQ